MYQLFTIWSGMLVATMMGINGVLSLKYGLLGSTFLIHGIAVCSCGGICVIKRDFFSKIKGVPRWTYFGGAIGIMITILNNFAFGKISMVSIVALGLLGQTIFALWTDQIGWMGMKRHPFEESSLLGLLIALVGMIYMMVGGVYESILAILFSLLSGVFIVLSRSLNSRLADYVGMCQSTMISLLVGLLSSGCLLFFYGDMGASLIQTVEWGKWWIYSGGCFAAVIVLLNNIVVPHISSFQVTMYMFLGQIFTGIFIDMVLYQSFEEKTFIGGIIISLGVLCNMVMKRYMENMK